jgi:hypothetical protein
VSDLPPLCGATISLGSPTSQYKTRSGWGKWRTVFVYRCPQCGGETRLFASAFRGKTPEPGVGGVLCNHRPGLTVATKESV